MKGIDKKEKGKYIAVLVSVFVMIVSIAGYTYSYFSATVNGNPSQSIIQTNKLELVYTGTKEITTGNNMIPGDSFTKTFSVYNPSNVAVVYNIYMENITNEFNEDLVYTLTDEDGTVVGETPLPKTSEKDYLKTNLSIDPKETKNYTIKIEFKYLEDKPQNGYQGKNFKATLGVDAEQIKELASNISYSYPEYTDCETVYCSLEELEAQILGQ